VGGPRRAPLRPSHPSPPPPHSCAYRLHRPNNDAEATHKTTSDPPPSPHGPTSWGGRGAVRECGQVAWRMAAPARPPGMRGFFSCAREYPCFNLLLQTGRRGIASSKRKLHRNWRVTRSSKIARCCDDGKRMERRAPKVRQDRPAAATRSDHSLLRWACRFFDSIWLRRGHAQSAAPTLSELLACGVFCFFFAGVMFVVFCLVLSSAMKPVPICDKVRRGGAMIL